MYIKSVELSNYRNYDSLDLDLNNGNTILYGDNAQGKTNILEAIGMCATARSHRRNKDSELIKFGCEEAHIKTVLNKDNEDISIDMHLRKGTNKFIAINKEKVPKVSDLIGIMNIIFFSPEDLNIIKDGPVFRRNFVDMQLCQLDNFYIYNLMGLIGGKGIGIQGFSAKALHNTIIPLPPLKEQERIVKKIEILFNRMMS